MNRLHKISFALFGKYVKKNKEDYSGLQLAIKQSHFGIPWDFYASTAYFFAVIVFVTGLVSGYLLMPLWHFFYTVYLKAVSQTGLKGFELLSTYYEPVFVLFSLLFFSLLLSLLTYYSIITYPTLTARIRKSKIDLTLPHVVAYMHALSKGGMNLVSIFKSLNNHTDIYGEAADEIRYILIDTEMHGNDLVTSLKNAAIQTQSEKFKDFLDNLVNIIETGGNVEYFLSNMVDYYQRTTEADQNMYLETLGILAETYVTVFVAGPLFLITLIIVMGLVGNSSLLLLKFIVYLVIPLCAALFSTLLSTVSINNSIETNKIYSVSKKIKHYDNIRTDILEDDERRMRKLFRSLRWTNIYQSRRTPFKKLFSDPFKTFYISAPAAVIFFILSLYNRTINIDLLDDSIILSTMILLVPFMFFYNMQNRRIRLIESSVPGFLRRLAGINDVGMPLADAIKSISRINLGVLSTEVKHIYKDLVWSNSVNESLFKFERRVRTVAISRVVILIAKASETTGNIKDVLRVASNDAALAEKLRRQRVTTMVSYTVVVYISFAVFLLVLYVFATMFLPVIPDSSESSTGMFSAAIDKEAYIRLFMHATVIQGFFSGIIIGQMTAGRIYDGLNHSVLMMGVAYVFFIFFV
ncbi:MAG: type II secretion system F family protein [Candidatus Methanoperedenaceae archaeon]|nr:type II secretion system F family protein [Candidatus Methanoperedenaceae archaeon]